MLVKDAVHVFDGDEVQLDLTLLRIDFLTQQATVMPLSDGRSGIETVRVMTHSGITLHSARLKKTSGQALKNPYC